MNTDWLPTAPGYLLLMTVGMVGLAVPPAQATAPPLDNLGSAERLSFSLDPMDEAPEDPEPSLHLQQSPVASAMADPDSGESPLAIPEAGLQPPVGEATGTHGVSRLPPPPFSSALAVPDASVGAAAEGMSPDLSQGAELPAAENAAPQDAGESGGLVEADTSGDLDRDPFTQAIAPPSDCRPVELDFSDPPCLVAPDGKSGQESPSSVAPMAVGGPTQDPVSLAPTSSGASSEGAVSSILPPPSEMAAPAPASARGVPAAIFVGGADSLAARAIGYAEGTRTASGAKTDAYGGHRDPGNGAWNLGTFSYQHGARSPAEADQMQLLRLRQQAETLSRHAQALDMDWTLEEWLNALDLANQSPRAALNPGGYADRLKQAHMQGFTGSKAIVWARTYAFLDPQTGRWTASGLGNTFPRIMADQSRRQQAIARVLAESAAGSGAAVLPQPTQGMLSGRLSGSGGAIAPQSPPPSSLHPLSREPVPLEFLLSTALSQF